MHLRDSAATRRLRMEYLSLNHADHVTQSLTSSTPSISKMCLQCVEAVQHNCTDIVERNPRFRVSQRYSFSLLAYQTYSEYDPPHYKTLGLKLRVVDLASRGT